MRGTEVNRATGTRPLSVLAILLFVLPSPIRAQGELDLVELQRAALARDARTSQHGLVVRSAAVRIGSVRTDYKPRFTLTGNNLHASDVTHLTFPLGAVSPPIPPRDRWGLSLDVSQLLYDGGVTARRTQVERRSLAEREARIDAALQPIRDEVTRAFFSFALLEASELQLRAAAQALEQMLADTRLRVREGAALGRDSAEVRIEYLGVLSRLEEVQSERRAAASVLGALTGLPIDLSSKAALPDWSDVVSGLEDPSKLRERPEFRRMERSRERLEAESDLAGSQNRPRLVAFGSAGVGRPGLNQFDPDAASFWQAGVRLEWTPFTWGSAARDRELARLEREIIDSDERAFAEQLARAVESDRQERSRLMTQLRADDEVIVLRSLVVEQGEAQRKEGVITAAEAARLVTELAEARLEKERHRIELAFAEVRIAVTLGVWPN